MKKSAAGSPDNGFPGKEAWADVIAVLDMATAVINRNAVADGVENRLELSGLGAQPQIGRFQFLDLLFNIGIKTDLGAVEPQEALKTCLIYMGTFDFAH
jgi:hypothetical protein